MPNNASDSDLNSLLRQARKNAHLTQDELGRLLGVDQSTIAKFESGRIDIPSGRLIQLSRILGFELILVPKEKLTAIRAVLKPPTRTAETTTFANLLGVDDEED